MPLTRRPVRGHHTGLSTATGRPDWGRPSNCVWRPRDQASLIEKALSCSGFGASNLSYLRDAEYAFRAHVFARESEARHRLSRHLRFLARFGGQSAGGFTGSGFSTWPVYQYKFPAAVGLTVMTGFVEVAGRRGSGG